jgi:PERQ amino acid-rich with GYF domain-containing protein
LSYSRATHTPTTPGFPADSSYFPYTEPNGHANGNPHPFRYSREQMLGLWDEEKVRNTPIELVDMLENGGVLVSKTVVRPIGLREPTENEKKVCHFRASV